jgi:chorismate mutase
VAVRGIRGATTVESDSAKEIEESTTELLRQLVDANDIDPSDIAGAWFTTTRDLAAEFPAVAARKLGWTEVPLLCGHEMNVVESNPRSIDHCIRVMILLNTDRPAADMKFIYLRRAAEIKADLDRLKANRGDE